MGALNHYRAVLLADPQSYAARRQFVNLDNSLRFSILHLKCCFRMALARYC